MKTEIRNINFKYISKISSKYKELIGVGSERCVHKFCSQMELLLELRSKESQFEGIKFKIVTPRVPEKYVDTVIKYIKEVNDKFNVEAIVINDYGIMNRLSKIEKTKLPMILGRTLIRSLEYVPWSYYTLRNEDLEIKKNLLVPNIYHSSKLELFSNFNIVGVEICATPISGAVVSMLKEKGIKIFVHFNTAIAAIGRTCPTVRIYNAKVGACTGLCDDILNVELNSNWGGDSTGNIKIVPTYKCIGNTVYYYRTDTKEFPYEDCDGIIYDYVMNLDEVNKIIS